MKKNIITIILVVLLIGSIGCIWFLQQGKTKLEKENTTLNNKITVLTSEKADLQNKIDKGSVYTKTLNLILDPSREQLSLPTSQKFSSEKDWLAAFTTATEATTDSELQKDLNDIKAGGKGASKATILYMDHSISTILNTLK
ncbi:MAG: hypothetical protein PHG83_03750 [Patescibacteria group bacterium]|jgi:hypothetical protein|nr:hypothetical protein [Patescibacteria group bacterium]